MPYSILNLLVIGILLKAACIPGVASGQQALQEFPCNAGEPVEGPSYPDLYCIDLFAAPGIRASGIVRLLPVDGPFGVAVTPEGILRYSIRAVLKDLPSPEQLGEYTTYLAWAATPTFDRVVKLGILGAAGTFDLGEIGFSKFLILITAEASDTATVRRGKLVLRGQSPSSVLQPHDVFSLTPLAAFAPDVREAPHHHSSGSNSAGTDSRNHGAIAESMPTSHGHLPLPESKSGVGWAMPPDHPRVAMAPGMAGLQPSVSPYLPSADLSEVPPARPREFMPVADGDTVSLTSGVVRRTIGGRPLLMFGFNQQYPGPLIYVKEEATVTVRFTNDLPLPSAVHWHGVRLDNPFDGVPGLTQDPVLPGESFTYTIHFPDAGIYWYHPHQREDIQQDLGLYGNILVRPADSGYYNSVDREEVLMLDDLLIGDEGLVPYGRESANFMLMGRFGNVFLVNGEPDFRTEVGQGEVVRFFLTNVSNTRTFNLNFDGLRLKVIGSDVGKFERETWAESVVIGPAERYIIEVLFDRPGPVALTNQVQALNHQAGSFFPEVDTLAVFHVTPSSIVSQSAAKFESLRSNPDVVQEIDGYRNEFERDVDQELVMTMRVENLPEVVSQMMRLDPIYFNPVEWSDTMPMMNWISTGNEVSWILRDVATGRENMDIEWNFERGNVAKIRVHNDRNAFHAMQHPLHIHGQRFLILERDGVRNENFVWKDTITIPVGATVDLLVDLSNPGKWMVHCHIAEHLESGMMMVMSVVQ